MWWRWHNIKQLWFSSATWAIVKTVYFLTLTHISDTPTFTATGEGLVGDKIPSSCLYVSNHEGCFLNCREIFSWSASKFSTSLVFLFIYPTSECFHFPGSIMFLVTRLESHLTSYKLSYIYLTTFWLNLLLLHNIFLPTLKYSWENIKLLQFFNTTKKRRENFNDLMV